MKRLNGKEDISIHCEILLHFISVFFFLVPTLITFPVVDNDMPHVTRAQHHGWRFNIQSWLFSFFLFLLFCFGQNDKLIFQRREKASGAANESQAVRVCLQVALCPGGNSKLSSRDF